MLKVLLAIAAMSATTPLVAAGPETPPSVHVRYTDLDLTTAAGKAQLDRRIDHALRKVCVDDTVASLSQRLDEIVCRRAAVAQIDAQLSQALATAAPHRTEMVETARRPTSGTD